MKSELIRLLFVVNSLHVGGAEKHAVTLLNHLDPARFHASLAYLKRQDALLSQVDAGARTGKVFSCDVSRKVDWRAVSQLAETIRAERIDIVVSVNTYSLLYAWLARARSGRRPRMVQIYHTTELGSASARMRMAVYRPLFMLCDMLVYVCEQQRRHWRAQALWARADTVIYNGIDSQQFVDFYTDSAKLELRRRYGLSGDDYVIGLCAAMRPEKAHGDLLRALVRLRTEWPEARLLLMGDGPERARIEQQIAALGLQGCVALTGLLDDVRPAIAACDVMALVSHHVETFSLAALESMALEKPMVMSRIGGAEEQVVDGETGYLFPSGDIEALTGVLRKLKDRDHCRRLGKQARRVVEQRFSLPRMVDAYQLLFAELGMPAVPVHRERHAD